MSDLLPPPVDIGLPPQFTRWRVGQPEAIIHAIETPKRFVGLVLPTGFGKSITYMTLAKLVGTRSVVLTSTLALQNQLETEFASLPGVALVKGQRRYLCKAVQLGGEHYAQYGDPTSSYSRGLATVDTAPCHLGIQCSLKAAGCGYFDALRLTQHSETEIIITNYAWWLSLYRTRPQGYVLRPDLLILDEAHAAPDALADALGASITPELVSKVFGGEALPMARGRSTIQWSGWAKSRASSLKLMLENKQLANRDQVHATRRAQTLYYSLERIATIDPDILLVSDERDAVRFDVLWAAPYGEPWLFRGVPKVVLTSATMSAHTADLVGIVDGELSMYEAGDGFPVHRRLIHIAPASSPLDVPIRVDMRMTKVDERCLLDHIDRIVAPRADRKGIIHCVSYLRRDWLLANSSHRGRMMTHSRADTQDQIKRFRSAAPGTIFVSPSLTTGYDFPYEDCEYQIVVKIPFPDSRDPVVKARTTVDPVYPSHLAMQQLVQMSGRGMRAEDDQCECVAPHTRILTADLRWVEADALQPGDRLLAFDEEPTKQGRGYGRRWQWGRVVKARTSVMPRMQITLADGTDLICTPNHMWVVRGRNGLHTWKRTDALRPGAQLIQVATPWDDPSTWDEGWVGGFADGEGCLVHRHTTRNPNVTGLYLTQNTGVVLDHAVLLLSSYGFAFDIGKRSVKGRAIRLHGGAAEIWRFLGIFRPLRLLNKFAASPRAERITRSSWATIDRVTALADGPITSLQTDVRTFVAEGFLAHNTFITDAHANWFLGMHKLLAPQWFRRAIRRGAAGSVPVPPPPLGREKS